MEDRIETLEVKSAHMEMSVDTLTQTVLEQEQQILNLKAEIELIKSMLAQITPSAVVSEADEPPPPHY